MVAFSLGILSSLITSAMCAALVWLTSTRFRSWLTALLSRLTGVGLERVYATQAEANRSLANELSRARWVKILAGRGNELTRDQFAVAWANVPARITAIEVLPDPESAGGDSWLAARESEMSQHDRGFAPGLLADQIRTNIAYIRAQAHGRPAVEMRLFDFPHLCRIVATDRVVFLTTYNEKEHGRNSPCFAFRRATPLYDFALRIFQSVWQGARPVRAGSS
jgi:hypothetical protein